MKEQELIKRIEQLFAFGSRDYIERNEVLNLVKQLDEPETVKIPQMVADIIEEYKDKGAPIIDIFTEKYSNEEYNTWLVNELNAYDRAARAWLDGYEVEKEKRYLVTLKNGQPLVKSQSGNTLYFNQNITAGNYKASRKELEAADFGWVFDCEGIEEDL